MGWWVDVLGRHARAISGALPTGAEGVWIWGDGDGRGIDGGPGGLRVRVMTGTVVVGVADLRGLGVAPGEVGRVEVRRGALDLDRGSGQ